MAAAAARVRSARRGAHPRLAGGRQAPPRRASRSRQAPDSPCGFIRLRDPASSVGFRRREDRRRQGDQARRVPHRADAGRRARADQPRPRGDRSRRAPGWAARFRTSAYERVGARDRLGRRGLGPSDLLLKVKEPIAAEYGAAARGPDALHVPPHRGRRAADARARRLGRHGGRLRDGRDGARRAAAARADVARSRAGSRRRPARTSSRSRSAAAGCCSAACPASLRAGS